MSHIICIFRKLLYFLILLLENTTATSKRASSFEKSQRFTISSRNFASFPRFPRLNYPSFHMFFLVLFEVSVGGCGTHTIRFPDSLSEVVYIHMKPLEVFLKYLLCLLGKGVALHTTISLEKKTF